MTHLSSKELLLFIPLLPEDVRLHWPEFYHIEGQFYGLELDAGMGTFEKTYRVGLFGLKDLTQGTKEMELLIFKGHRHRVLTKERLQQLLDFTSSQGTKKAILNTQLKSLRRVCRRFGFKELYTDPQGRMWMIKEF
jgi:hypothetical protein